MDRQFETLSRQARTELGKPVGEHDFDKARALEQLRSKLATLRDRAQARAEEGTIDASLIQARIDALGPEPGEGQSEPAYITARRDKLRAEQEKFLEPVFRLRDVQFGSATLVRAVDQRIHDLANRRLFSQGASPLDPRLWVRATKDFSAQRKRHITGQQAAPAAQVSGQGGWLARVAGILAILALGWGLNRYVWQRLRAALERRVAQAEYAAKGLALTLLADFVSAIVLIFAMVLGVVAMGLFLSGLMRPEIVLTLVISLVIAAILLAAAQWLGRSIALAPVRELRLLHLPDERAQRTFRIIRSLGAIMAFEVLIELLEESALLPFSLSSILSALVIILGSVLIWRLATAIDWKKPPEPVAEAALAGEVDATAKATIDFIGPLSRIAKFLSLVAIGTALFGYVMLAREVFSGVLLSLAVIALCIFVHRAIKLVVAAFIAGPLAGYRRMLRFVPMAAGFVLLMVALFLIALVWGYRLQEIGDFVVMLRTGVEFGDVRISAGDVFTFGLVFIVGYIVTRWVQRFLRVSVLPEFGMEPGAQAAIVTGLGYVGIMLAAVIAIASTGLDLSSLAFVFGALSVGIGFGLQSVVENFTSGILLLIERPVRVGDWIEVGEHSGVVKKIAVRSTQIETWDRHQIIIPNSQLISGAVKNYSFTGGPARVIVPVGVSYDADVDHVKQVLLDIAKADERVLAFPEAFVTLAGFGDNSVDLKLFAYVADVTSGAGVASDLNFAIARRFRSEEIEIPYPQRDLHIRGELPLAAPAQSGSAG